jgi:hypothetical protein
VVLLANNCHAFAKDISTASNISEFEDVLFWLRKRGVKYGYADYWEAYTISFLAKEEIILEPTYFNYLPYHGPTVARAKQLAFVNPWPVEEKNGYLFITYFPTFPSKSDNQITERFRILDRAVIRGTYVYLIER